MSRFQSSLSYLLLLAGLTVGWEQTAPSATAQELTVALAPDQEVADPFARLRRPHTTAQAEYWRAVGRELAKLETLDGAAYDARYGVLTLHGQIAQQGRGPFHLDDLIVALQAALFQTQDLGMTIDPDQQDPEGPEMVVRYFGGCEDTAFGWVLFECDRLLKSLSNGEDNLTGQPLKPKVDGFQNMLERGLKVKAGPRETGQWNRFWLATDLRDGPTWRDKPGQSDGYQPFLYETQDGSAICLQHCRLYLRTEVMQLQGGQLVPAQGRASPIAEQFAGHFNDHFEDFARQFPVFGRAAALSRLTVLAEWIVKSAIPVDVQFIRDNQPQVRIRTPRFTAANHTSLTAKERVAGGVMNYVLKSFGGVDFRPRGFYATDVDGKAEQHRQLAANGAASHLREIAWQDTLQGSPVQVVVIPTWKTRLNPVTPPSVVNTSFQRSPPPPAPPSSGSAGSGSAGRSPNNRRPLTGVERTNRVAREAALTLASIDRARTALESAPPDQPLPLYDVEDVRYVPRAGRSEAVGRESAPLAKAPDGDPNKVRGPPTDPASPALSASAPKVPEPGVGLRPPPLATDYSPQADRSSQVGREPATLTPAPDGGVNSPRGPPQPDAFRPIADRMQVVARERVELRPQSANAAWGFPIFQTRETSATYNLPRMVEQTNPKIFRKMEIQTRAGLTTVPIVDQLALVSELGDILVTFSEPELDQERGLVYYPPTPAGSFDLVGYYPQARTLLFQDGMQVKFDQQGRPTAVRAEDGTNFEFQYDEAAETDSWPRPEFCRVQPANGRAEAGAYRLTEDRPPPTAVAEHAPGDPDTADSPEIASSQDPLRQSTATLNASRSGMPTTATETRAEQPNAALFGADAARSDSNSDARTPPGPEVAHVTANLTREAGGGRAESRLQTTPPVQIPDAPLAVQPPPDQLNYWRIQPRLAPGDSMVVGQPLQFHATGPDLQWSARLRSSETPPDVYDTPNWEGDRLLVRAVDGSPLQLSLENAEGTFRANETGLVRLVATRSADAAATDAPSAVDFFVDVQVRWNVGESSRESRMSLPVRLESRASAPVAAVIVVALILGLAVTGIVIVLIQRPATALRQGSEANDRNPDHDEDPPW